MTALSTVLNGPRELPLLTWASGMAKLAKRTTPTDPVARRIWEAMTVRGFSQRHIERTAGFVPGYMTRVLDGERNFTLQTLQAITQALRVNVDWLVTGKGPRDIGAEGGGDPYERALGCSSSLRTVAQGRGGVREPVNDAHGTAGRLAGGGRGRPAGAHPTFAGPFTQMAGSAHGSQATLPPQP